MKMLLLALVLMSAGCAHVVTDDYDRYLVNNKGTAFPTAKYKAEYSIDKTTLEHEYKFGSAMAGAANTWIVKFGDLLEKTMQSEDVQKAFGGIVQSRGGTLSMAPNGVMMVTEDANPKKPYPLKLVRGKTSTAAEKKVSVEKKDSASLRNIRFMLVDYQFRDKRALVKLNIKLENGSKVLLDKTYSEEGNTQGGKMFWAGAAGMKNAVHQSTKFALDKILTAFINESNAVK